MVGLHVLRGFEKGETAPLTHDARQAMRSPPPLRRSGDILRLLQSSAGQRHAWLEMIGFMNNRHEGNESHDVKRESK